MEVYEGCCFLLDDIGVDVTLKYEENYGLGTVDPSVVSQMYDAASSTVYFHALKPGRTTITANTVSGASTSLTVAVKSLGLPAAAKKSPLDVGIILSGSGFDQDMISYLEPYFEKYGWHTYYVNLRFGMPAQEALKSFVSQDVDLIVFFGEKMNLSSVDFDWSRDAGIETLVINDSNVQLLPKFVTALREKSYL